jgi:hypothetical protein
MSDERRTVGDTSFEIKQSFWIAGKEILFAENEGALDGMSYLVGQYLDNGVFGEYSQLIKFDDCLEALQDFTKRLEAEIAAIRAERDALGLPVKLFVADDCYPLVSSESIKDKVVAIKASALNPEYRRGDVQLVYAVGGNGTSPHALGSAVFCYHLNNGRYTRFERRDVLGVVKVLPDWAQKSLVLIKSEMEKPVETKEFAGNYGILERIEAGRKVYALGHNPKAFQPWGTWQGHKDSLCDFEQGHYFETYEEAKTDLLCRAANEMGRQKSKRQSDKRKDAHER